MHIAFASKPAARATHVRLLSIFERSKLPAGVREAELSLKANTRLYLHGEDTLYVGLGDPGEINAETIRRAVGTAALTLKKAGRLQINLHLDRYPQFVGAAVEGLVLGDYRFEDFKVSKSPGIEKVTVIVNGADLRAAKRDGARAETVAEVTNIARQIANQPGNVIYPSSLADEAAWHAREFGLRCTVLDEKKLRAGKFGGILAVGEGSARPPRFIILEHRGGSPKDAPIALVGKAVTFDTGGISIKPAAEMEKMIWDKCGGAAVMGAMFAIAALKLKRNVVGLIPCAENMPSANAYRPGDIVTCYDGKHVEIVNTDAEGRMILADAIGYARKHFKAAAIIDVATLTGACGVALGDSAAGLWSTDSLLHERLLSASAAAGERLWPMPLYPEYEEQIRSEVALIKNSGGRLAGACTGATFLKTFAEKTPWAHLDVAYTAFSEKERPWIARGATGFALRTLVNLVEAGL